MSKSNTPLYAGIAGTLIVIILLCYGGWRLERWINWKFGYSDKVETRLVELEGRIDVLECEGK